MFSMVPFQFFKVFLVTAFLCLTLAQDQNPVRTSANQLSETASPSSSTMSDTRTLGLLGGGGGGGLYGGRYGSGRQGLFGGLFSNLLGGGNSYPQAGIGGFGGGYPSYGGYPGYGGNPLYASGYPGGYSGGYPGGYPGGYAGGYPGGYPGGYAGGYPGGYASGYPGGFYG